MLVVVTVCQSNFVRVTAGSSAFLGQLPWQVARSITDSTGSYLCGGSIIAPTFILTAAHCIVDNVARIVQVGAEPKVPLFSANFLCSTRRTSSFVPALIGQTRPSSVVCCGIGTNRHTWGASPAPASIRPSLS